jgi:CBS domain-containing protein
MTAVPSVVAELLSSTPPFDQLSESRREAVAKKSAWVYLAKNEEATFLEQHGGDVCVIHSGQFVVQRSDQPAQYLSEGDLFGAIDSEHQNYQVTVDLAGLVCCIPKPVFDDLHDEHHVTQFVEGRQSDTAHTSTNHAHGMWMYKTLKDTLSREPVTISDTASIHQAAKCMTECGVSSVLVTSENGLVGIVTDRDLRTRVVAKNVDINLRVTSVMTIKPRTILQSKTVFDALCKMNENRIHHLPIVDVDGVTPKGMITATDVLKHQRNNVLYLMDELSKAPSLYELSTAAWQIPHYFASNAKRPSDFDIAGKVLSQATDIMTRKLIAFYQQENGEAPMKYAWLVYGSQAREDQTLGSDQDNALLLERKMNDTESDYFAAMSKYVCEGLHKCGIQRCPGNIMASNPKLRLDLPAAIDEARKWVNAPTPQAMLNFNIFLDVRMIAGDKSLFEKLAEARSPMLKQRQFVAALARQANDTTVPLSLFNRFVFTQHGEHKQCIDIKTQAVSIVNSLVRNYALFAGIREPGTMARLERLPEYEGLSERNAKNLREVWLFLNRLRWRHQIHNHVTDNFVRVDSLSSMEKYQLKQAFKAIERAQQSALNYFAGGMAG